VRKKKEEALKKYPRPKFLCTFNNNNQPTKINSQKILKTLTLVWRRKKKQWTWRRRRRRNKAKEGEEER